LEKNFDDIIIGRLIKKLRRDKERSQAQLAEAIGMQQNVMSRIELGIRQVSLSELRAICQYLRVGLSEFVQEYEARVQDRDQS